MELNKESIATEIIHLVEIIQKLRSENGGCSWDRKQTHKTLAKFIREESEEVIQAIESEDVLNIVEELGDLLMLIVFNAQIGSENGTFTLADVAKCISNKLVSRHPHVFGEVKRGIAPEKVLEIWGELKEKEKVERKKVVNRMKEALRFPSAIRLTEKVQTEAASVGFDFPSAEEALKKVQEEVDEISESMHQEDTNVEQIAEEVGDLLFSVVNLSRLCGIDAEECLKKASEKFVFRFAKVEKMVGGDFSGKSLAELDKYWEEVKKN